MMPADLGQVEQVIEEVVSGNPFKDKESALSSSSSEEELRPSTVIRKTNKVIADCPVMTGGKVPDKITFTVC